jgi:hypothetical protein
MLVQKSFEIGYLSIETEQELQRLVSLGCSAEDLDLLMVLNQAIVFGHVKRQARNAQPLEFKALTKFS